MDNFMALLGLVTLTAVRCLFPLILTMGVGCLLHRVIAGWEAETT